MAVNIYGALAIDQMLLETLPLLSLPTLWTGKLNMPVFEGGRQHKATHLLLVAFFW